MPRQHLAHPETDMLKLIPTQDQDRPRPLPEDGREPPKILAVGGGKGGVGKSFIAANLGMALAKSGKRVVLVDLDLGGANLHTCLGLGQIKSSISDFFTNSRYLVNDLIVDTNIPHLGFISGASNALDIANLKYFQKAKIIRNLPRIESDYVVLDLGAGTTFNTLDFFLAADCSLVIVTPEPAAIENTYRFIKSVFMRKLKSGQIPPDLRKIIHQVMMQHHAGGIRLKTLADFFAETEKTDALAASWVRSELENINIQLIVNQIQHPSDVEVGHSFSLACKTYFGIGIEYAGYLHHDPIVLHTIRNKKPFLLENPRSRISIGLKNIAQTISGSKNT